jgi:hypothetical protein
MTQEVHDSESLHSRPRLGWPCRHGLKATTRGHLLSFKSESSESVTRSRMKATRARRCGSQNLQHAPPHMLLAMRLPLKSGTSSSSAAAAAAAAAAATYRRRWRWRRWGCASARTRGVRKAMRTPCLWRRNGGYGGRFMRLAADGSLWLAMHYDRD